MKILLSLFCCGVWFVLQLQSMRWVCICFLMPMKSFHPVVQQNRYKIASIIHVVSRDRKNLEALRCFQNFTVDVTNLLLLTLYTTYSLTFIPFAALLNWRHDNFPWFVLCPIYSKTKAQLFPADHQKPMPDDRLMIVERHYFTYIHSTVIRVIPFTMNAV